MNMTLKVASKAAIAKDIYRFEFRHMDGGPLPAFTAGAHIPVQTPSKFAFSRTFFRVRLLTEPKFSRDDDDRWNSSPG